MEINEQKNAAREFAKNWLNRGDEKSDSNTFWLTLLRNVYGIKNPDQYIEFEKRVDLGHKSFIDAYIKETKTLIEQKSIDVDLLAKHQQSDGTMLNAYEQAKRYANEMKASEKPRWIITSNFKQFRIYDLDKEKPEENSVIVELHNLATDYIKLSMLADPKVEQIRNEMQVSKDAGELVGRIYDALYKQYINPENEHSLKSLNILCVRLVFCLYAEDAGLFGKKDSFHDYLMQFDEKNIRQGLISLFKVLDTKDDKRDPYMDATLASFPYVNGGLFADENIEIPNITEQIRYIILQKASMEFDWSDISPVIFGAVFESTLNPITRRSGGMHYTSIENIHKVIDPQFLDDLKQELDNIKDIKVENKRKSALNAYQDKIASLTFLDPACGSGNFLTETYLSLRRLENEVLKEKGQGMGYLGFDNIIKVNIGQFYGIEINDFAVTVAKTALWIAESQMLQETEEILHREIDFFPLKTNAGIVEGNALQTDWESVVPKDKLNYIMGNPPFVGARLMDERQKKDMLDIFGPKWKNIGNIDYVGAWYYKAVQMMQGNAIQTALVSTNSITQGEQVANLWKPLFEDYGTQINFAHRTFRWDSEASIKAHVHCVIVGFSCLENGMQKSIFNESGTLATVKNINPYLVDAPVAWIESINKPLCDVPMMGVGSQAIDNGQYIFDEEQKREFIKKEPLASQYFHRWYGSDEFINNRVRWCLYLGDCTPNELRSMPECLKRVQLVKEFRLASKRAQTLKSAEYPHRFSMTIIPDTNYLIVPRVSSERRRFVPIGFMSPDNLVNDAVQIIPNATLYHFGILTSSVHMAWMRTVCGRLKSDYRYSKDIVYNNFPWPEPTEGQKAKIEKTAQAILDARTLYPESSLADLYDETLMPVELRKAHQDNDKAVMEAYGFKPTMSESEVVAELFKLYEKLTNQN
ncbi:MAG: N-6 DNA methylase [Bacteroidales bacterium]|nr:N-6 DNA methylase [Bacteroidales bacterium]